ncbi:MAG: SDR family NAD(P)-dependent oxidoreductase [Ignavibacteriota bacterium]
MSKKLEGKIALITGGSRGIGLRSPNAWLRTERQSPSRIPRGADAAGSVVKEIESGGGRAIAVQADASDAGAIKAAVEKAVKSLGKLDVLVNNAGTAIPKPFEQATLEELDQVIDINLRGTLVTTQAALKHMNNGGRIITIGSCVGERMMTPGLVSYAATKGAVKMFVQGLAREVGNRAITVNNVQPGPIDTS